MEVQIKKSAVDLTDLAIGIIVLGIVVTIGASILLNMRDANLTSLQVVTTTNESITPSATATLTNKWGKGVTGVVNNSGASIASGNYTVSVSQLDGTMTISNASQAGNFGSGAWKVTYQWYNTSGTQWALPNQAAVGLSEYGNWFEIIVIVGVAAVVLSLIFLSFGRPNGSGGVSY